MVKIVQRAVSGEEGYSTDEMEELGPIQEDSVWEGGATESDLENVGWMYMEVDDYVSLLESLSQPGDWEDEYLRPPQMRWRDDFEDAPGSWRRIEYYIKKHLHLGFGSVTLKSTPRGPRRLLAAPVVPRIGAKAVVTHQLPLESQTGGQWSILLTWTTYVDNPTPLTYH